MFYKSVWTTAKNGAYNTNTPIAKILCADNQCAQPEGRGRRKSNLHQCRFPLDSPL